MSEFDDQDDDGEILSSNGGGGGNKHRKREKNKKDATFMDGVTGVHLVTDKNKISRIQRRIQDMCEWTE